MPAVPDLALCHQVQIGTAGARRKSGTGCLTKEGSIMNVAHVIGVDPGIVDTGCVSIPGLQSSTISSWN